MSPEDHRLTYGCRMMGLNHRTISKELRKMIATPELDRKDWERFARLVREAQRK